MTKFNNDFSKEVYEQTYKFEGNDIVGSDGDINGTQARTAKGTAKVEKKSLIPKYEREFLRVQQDFKCVLGGRITSNAGTGLKGTTMINCYVSGPGGTEQDSIKGIMRELQKQALILKSEGGYGFCADFMRPRGAYIEGIGVESPGAVEMLSMWDTQSSVITKGAGQAKKKKKGKNKIRKGAMMVTMSVWHPSIREFITAKQKSGNLTKFNMSVLVTDEFMEAVKKKEKWNLEFPETSFENYDLEWDGNLELWKEKGYPVEVYETIEATELWGLIMTSTYNRNEPGVLFVDTINRKNNLKYCEHITATNPCVAGDCPILTDKGHEEIGPLVGKKVNIWNGQNFTSVVPRVTGYNQKMLTVYLSNGMSLRCTRYHGWVMGDGSRKPAKDLSPNEVLSDFNYPVIKGFKKITDGYLKKEIIPGPEHTVESRLEWLSMLISGDGRKLDNRIVVNSDDKSFLSKVQLMLTTLGAHSDLGESTLLLSEESGFKLQEMGLSTASIGKIKKPKNTSTRKIKVTGIEDSGYEEKVYCFTEYQNNTGVFNGIMTAQCGEQMLPVGGSCLLGSINLTQYIKEDLSGYDFEKLEQDIPVMVRMMDNVNDVTNYPLEEQKQQALRKRRIGLGYLGYGSSLYLLGLRYGSKEALRVTEELCKFVTNKAYQASALLAKEKGAFPDYIEEEYLKSDFLKGLDPETIEMIRKYGIRNSHLTSIQPTGNSSVFANNVSSGLEPIFLAEYIRTHVVPFPPKGLEVPDVDFVKRTFEGSSQEWEWTQEGDEDLLTTTLDGKTYKIDKNRGLLKEEKVQDYAVRELEKRGISMEGKDWAVNTSNLKIRDHIDTLKVFAKYIDSAMSKTVNLPEDYPYEDFKNLYMEVHATGLIKGCTTYRAGTMATVLSSTDKKDNKKATGDNGYIKRPKTLPCDIHQLTAAGEKWIVLVGLLDEKPYEVFAFKNKQVSLNSSVSHGQLTKVSGGKYELDCGGWVLQDVRSLFESDEQDALTRLISTSLRNGVDIEHIVAQLSKAEGSVVSFSKAIARTLKKHVKELKSFKCTECGSKNVALEDGCFKCLDCGGSKCS